MRRSAALGLAVWLGVGVAACALLEPPRPAGTFTVPGEVRNWRAQPVHLEVRTPVGVLPGAVQPASLPAGPLQSNVLFHLPLEGEWWIAINGDAFISSADFDSDLRRRCTIGIELNVDGSSAHGCAIGP